MTDHIYGALVLLGGMTATAIACLLLAALVSGIREVIDRHQSRTLEIKRLRQMVSEQATEIAALRNSLR